MSFISGNVYSDVGMNITPSLTHFLIENREEFDKDYSGFLAKKGGYPVLKHGKSWSLAKDFSAENSDYAAYMDFLAKKLAEEGGKPSPLYTTDFLMRFNSEWTNSRFKRHATLIKETEGDVLFYSKNQIFGWLSNFFPTLIYHTEGKEYGSIAYSLEISYKAFKYKDFFQDIIKGTNSLKAKRFKAKKAITAKHLQVPQSTPSQSISINVDAFAQIVKQSISDLSKNEYSSAASAAGSRSGSDDTLKINPQHASAASAAPVYSGRSSIADTINIKPHCDEDVSLLGASALEMKRYSSAPIVNFDSVSAYIGVNKINPGDSAASAAPVNNGLIGSDDLNPHFDEDAGPPKGPAPDMKRYSSAPTVNSRKVVVHDRPSDLKLMTILVFKKMEQNPVLAEWLDETRERTLIEDTHDAFWGRGPDGTGDNWLGKIAMSIRQARRK
jgi:predicted NAD-dependent protein-ADP-ribosyltransferase YbiA (DUF1768 family)